MNHHPKHILIRLLLWNSVAFCPMACGKKCENTNSEKEKQSDADTPLEGPGKNTNTPPDHRDKKQSDTDTSLEGPGKNTNTPPDHRDNRNNGAYPLHDAIQNRNVHKVRTLIQQGADYNKKDWRHAPYHKAWAESDFYQIKKKNLINHNEPCPSPLHRAIQLGCIEIVQLLLQAGTDPNEEDVCGSPLYRAAANNNSTLCQILLEAKADPNKGKDILRSPLEIAIEKNHAEIVKLLLNAPIEADPNKGKDILRSPLEQAIEKNNAEIVKLLLSAPIKADPNQGKDSLRSPLEQAKSMGNQAILKLLHQYGAHA